VLVVRSVAPGVTFGTMSGVLGDRLLYAVTTLLVRSRAFFVPQLRVYVRRRAVALRDAALANESCTSASCARVSTAVVTAALVVVVDDARVTARCSFCMLVS
jgi:hypothetical protein